MTFASPGLLALGALVVVALAPALSPLPAAGRRRWPRPVSPGRAARGRPGCG